MADKPQPAPPFKMTVSFGDGSKRERTAVNKKQVRQYHKDNAFAMARTGGLFIVTDASGRDVTSEVLWPKGLL